MAAAKFDEIVSLLKRRGFVYPGSEIYGGLANTYDYGPMGAEMLRTIRNLWWENFIHRRIDMVGMDASTISHQKIWEASGHTQSFADALVDCRNCRARIRTDHLIEDFLERKADSLKKHDIRTEVIGHEELLKAYESKKVEGWSIEAFDEFLKLFNVTCPTCGLKDWTQVRKFNQLFPVHLGIVEGEQSLAYLRGETAQGMFINFKNVLDTSRVKLPFGIGQLGKSFRNEITLGNSIFRTIEFEQAEIEYFFDPENQNWEVLFQEWKDSMWQFVTKILGVKEDNLRWRIHSDEERSFYSKRTEDLEYNFPFGFKELWGLAYRTDYDLKQHIKHSGADLTYFDPATERRFVPHVIEPAVGINRLLFMILCDCYWKDEERHRVVLKLPSQLAPFTAAVFPLVSNKEDITSKAREVHAMLNTKFRTAWDARGNIGKRYLAQDEVGTPFTITIDYQSLSDGDVTVRDRDSALQERVAIDGLIAYIEQKLKA
jgi:glycyl-tRNA synthetase